jgi:hypothetical protein
MRLVGVWVWSTNIVACRWVLRWPGAAWLVSVGLLLYFINYLFVLPFGRWECYPFASPMIPLCMDRHMKPVLRYVYALRGGRDMPKVPFVHIPSCAVSCDAIVAGQQVYHQLVRCVGLHRKSDLPAILVSAESFFKFGLEDYSDVVAWWQSCLMPGMVMLVGALHRTARENRSVWCQAVYAITSHSVKRIHVKTHGVPFAESMPHIFKRWPWIERAFFKEGCALHVAKGDALSYLSLGIYGRWAVLMCSEFFCGKWRSYIDTCSLAGIIVMVNDALFPCYFQRLMWGKAWLEHVFFGFPILYVAPGKCLRMSLISDRF